MNSWVPCHWTSFLIWLTVCGHTAKGSTHLMFHKSEVTIGCQWSHTESEAAVVNSQFASDVFLNVFGKVETCTVVCRVCHGSVTSSGRGQANQILAYLHVEPTPNWHQHRSSGAFQVVEKGYLSHPRPLQNHHLDFALFARLLVAWSQCPSPVW